MTADEESRRERLEDIQAKGGVTQWKPRSLRAQGKRKKKNGKGGESVRMAEKKASARSREKREQEKVRQTRHAIAEKNSL